MSENCSYCGSRLEVAAVACGKCGTPVPQPEPEPPTTKRSRRTRAEWMIFLGLLLLPGLLSPIIAAANKEDWWFAVAVFGSVPGAIYGGIWLSGLIAHRIALRIFLGTALSIALYITIVIGSAFAGCLVQPLSFH